MSCLLLQDLPGRIDPPLSSLRRGHASSDVRPHVPVLVCIPTTSGSGSDTSPFAVIAGDAAAPVARLLVSYDVR